MSRRTAVLLLVFCCLGLVASSLSAYVHYRLLRDPGYTSFCDINTTWNCETVYESRKLLEYYKVADAVSSMKVLPIIIKCTYDGRTYAIYKTKTVRLDLPEYLMPFQKSAVQVSIPQETM